MEIQQHNGVVVEAAAVSAGLCQAQRDGEVVQTCCGLCIQETMTIS